MAEKKKFNFAKQTVSPKLRIVKKGDGSYVIDYGQGDKNARKNIYNQADLNQEIQKLFGYESWDEYKQENREDLFRKKGPATEDGKLQVPTVFPFHVAYALEEFKDTFNPRDYEVVGVPKENIPFLSIDADTSWLETLTAMSPKDALEQFEELVTNPTADAMEGISDYLKMIFSGEGGKERAADERKKDIRKVARQQAADKKRAELEARAAAIANDVRRENLGIDPNTMAKISLVQQMRKAFFGSDGSNSILKMAMYEPLEVLSNKDVIKRVEDQFKSKFDINQKFQGNFPVNHPQSSGRFWSNDLKPAFLEYILNSLKGAVGMPENSVYSTGDQADAFVVDNDTARGALSQTTMLNEHALLMESAAVARVIDTAFAGAGRGLEKARGMDSWVRSIVKSRKPLQMLRRAAMDLTNPKLGGNPGLEEKLGDFYRKITPLSDADIAKWAKIIYIERNNLILSALKTAEKARADKLLGIDKLNIFKRELLKDMEKIVPGLGKDKDAIKFVRELDSAEDLRKASKELEPYDLRPLDGSEGKTLQQHSVDKGVQIAGMTARREEQLADWAKALAAAYARKIESARRVRPAAAVDAAPAILSRSVDEIKSAETITIRDVIADEKIAKAMEEAPMRPENIELLKRIEALERSGPGEQQLLQILEALANRPGADQEMIAVMQKILKQNQRAASKTAAQSAKEQARVAKELAKLGAKKGGKIYLFFGATLLGIWILCRDGQRCAVIIDAAMQGDFAKVIEEAIKAVKEFYEDGKKFLGIEDEEAPSEENPQNIQQASSRIGINLDFYLLPKGWRELNYLTPSEKVLADRIGAKTDVLKKMAKEKVVSKSVAPASQDVAPALASMNEVNALFFGHSQTSPLSKKLRAQIKKAGGKTKFIAHPFNDAGMAREIKNVKGKFTHAYLFLNGNSYPPYENLEASLYKNQKRKIIDYVQTSLGVPKDNILVVLPPVNNASYEEEDLRARLKNDRKVAKALSPKVQKQARKSRGRGAELNPPAREYFESLGVKVADPIVSTNPADFGDGLHISSLSSVSRKFQAGQLTNLSSKIKPPEAIKPIPPGSRDEETISTGQEVNILQHLAKDKVTIINFTNSTWCKACIALKPILEKVTSNSKVALRKINIETWEEPVIAQYGIDSIPYWAVFDPAGKLVASSKVDNKGKLIDLIVSDNTYNFRDVQNVVDKVLEKTGGQKTNISKDKSEVKKIIIDEARKAGVDPEFAVAIATIESALDPLANRDNNKSYKGLYMLGNMYKKYYKSEYNFDYDNVYNPRENTRVFLEIIKKNLRALRRDGVVKSPPSKIIPEEAGLLYLTHQQGLRGIRTQLKAASENASYTSLPKDIQSNIYKNVYDSPKHLKGMKWREWRKKMGEMYKRMGDEAKRLGVVPENSSARRAWRKLPESNPLYKEYASLANRYTPRRFVERWKDKTYREYIKALKKSGIS